MMHATGSGDPHGETDMDEQLVPTWLWTLHKHSGDRNPTLRFTSIGLCTMIAQVVIAEESGMPGRFASGARGSQDRTVEGTVTVAGVMRAMGDTAIIDQGRAAQKRIRSESGSASAVDKFLRNALRKARRRAANELTRQGV